MTRKTISDMENELAEFKRVVRITYDAAQREIGKKEMEIREAAKKYAQQRAREIK